jgi:hypothetical protein
MSSLNAREFWKFTDRSEDSTSGVVSGGNIVLNTLQAAPPHKVCYIHSIFYRTMVHPISSVKTLRLALDYTMKVYKLMQGFTSRSLSKLSQRQGMTPPRSVAPRPTLVEALWKNAPTLTRRRRTMFSVISPLKFLCMRCGVRKRVSLINLYHLLYGFNYPLP